MFCRRSSVRRERGRVWSTGSGRKPGNPLEELVIGDAPQTNRCSPYRQLLCLSRTNRRRNSFRSIRQRIGGIYEVSDG